MKYVIDLFYNAAKRTRLKPYANSYIVDANNTCEALVIWCIRHNIDPSLTLRLSDIKNYTKAEIYRYDKLIESMQKLHAYLVNVHPYEGDYNFNDLYTKNYFKHCQYYFVIDKHIPHHLKITDKYKIVKPSDFLYLKYS